MLALTFMKQNDKSAFPRMYADQTMSYGTFDKVRMNQNDLYNMLAIVSGDPEITKKLKNKNQAQAMRQRQPVPVMAVRRYLRTWENAYSFLTQLERSLGITDSHYRNLRRAVADYQRLDNRTKRQTAQKLLQLLKAKLPGTDITKKAKEVIES